MYLVLRIQEWLYQQTLALPEQRGITEYKVTTSRPSMMQAFMDSPSLPESEKSPERIKGEAQIAIGAGTLTTTHALKAATYHILANPEVKAQLMEELERCIPDLDSPTQSPPAGANALSYDRDVRVSTHFLWKFTPPTEDLPR